MVKHCIYFPLLLITWSSILAGTPRNLLQKAAEKNPLSEVLITDFSWVKYPEYTDRVGWDQLIGPIKKHLLEQGQSYLNYDWQTIALSSYMEFDRSGSREVMQKPYRENQQAMLALVLAELAEGRGRFIPKIADGTWFACEMTSWVLSAHLKSFQTATQLAIPDPNQFTIDLGSGNMGSFYAWVYYFFHDAFDSISPIISQRLRQNLQERILNPYIERDDYWWQAIEPGFSGRINNWNPWCNFNVLTTYLLLESDPNKLVQAVSRTLQSVDQFINYYNNDGACEEGPSYWGHAAGKLFDYLDLLATATNNRIHIFDHELIRNMGEYIAASYIGNQWVVNFADASAKAHLSAGLIYRYGRAVESDILMSFAGYLKDNSNPTSIILSSDLNRVLANFRMYKDLMDVSGALPDYAYQWFDETEFCYLKNNHFFLAAKGGFNDESHNHNDVGSFILAVDKVPILIDVGVGTYTRQTFSKERYTIWTMQSEYHNLPLINGFAQRDGSQFHAKHVTFNPTLQYFSLDISAAYPEEAEINEWIRSYQIISDSEIKITDAYSLRAVKNETEINFITWSEPNIEEAGRVDLTTEGVHTAILYDNTHLRAVVEQIPLDDRRLSSVWGTQIYRLQLQKIDSASEGILTYRVQRNP